MITTVTLCRNRLVGGDDVRRDDVERPFSKSQSHGSAIARRHHGKGIQEAHRTVIPISGTAPRVSPVVNRLHPDTIDPRKTACHLLFIIPKSHKTMNYKLPILLLALAITSAHAATWTPIDDTVSFDQESVDQTDKDALKVTWRTKEMLANYTLTSEINCDLGLITTLWGTSISSNAVQTPPVTTDWDFLTKTRTQNGKVTSIDLDAKMWLHRFPSPNTGEGRLVARLCGINTAAEVARSRAAFAETMCKDKSSSDRYLCTMDDRGHLQYQHLIKLVGMTKRACGLTEEQVSNIQFGWFNEFFRCGVRSETCPREMNYKARRVARDLSDVLSGETCTYIPKAQAEIDQMAAKASALAVYGKCLRDRAVTLDDGVSSADVIARAILSQCRNVAPEDMLSSSLSQPAVDSITARVLENRQVKRNAAPKAR